MVTTPFALPMAIVWNVEPVAEHDESQEQGSLPLARFLLTSLAFHGETSHTKTKISRKGAGSLSYATWAK
jgi:hypothetical protein